MNDSLSVTTILNKSVLMSHKLPLQLLNAALKPYTNNKSNFYEKPLCSNE